MSARAWYFTHESAIYERIGFDPVLECAPVCSGDHTMREWRDQPVYRYFWNWSLPPVTFTSEYLSVRFAWIDNYAFPWYFPAIWLDEFEEWVELSWSGGQE